MNIFDQRGEVLKSFISDAPRLLVGTREEKFKYERAIRMFQFQTWIFAPGEVAIKYAGLIAATKILRKIEEDVFLPEECTSEELPDITLEKICELRTKSSYWRSLYWDIYDKIIAAYGGLTALIDVPSPPNFDSSMIKNEGKAKIVLDLVEYRIRYALHGKGSANGANLNHAIF